MAEVKLYSDAEEVKMLRAIVNGLRRGSCWCEVGIGNPMTREHSTACKAATVIMGEPSDHFVLVPATMVKQEPEGPPRVFLEQCDVIGEPPSLDGGRAQCELTKGHEGYHQAGRVKWLGYFPKA